MKNDEKKSVKKTTKKKSTISKTKNTAPTKKKKTTVKKTATPKKKKTTVKKNTSVSKKSTSAAKKPTTVTKKTKKTVSAKRRIRKTTSKAQKKVTRVTKPKQIDVPKEIVQQEPIVEQKSEIKLEINKTKNKNPFIWILIIGIIAISLLFSIINVKEKKEVIYHFSSNLDFYTANVTNLDDENDEMNSEWINIKEDALIYATEGNHQLSIKNNNDDTIIDIDNENTYFDCFNQKYIAKPLNEKIIINYIFFCKGEDKNLSFASSSDCVNIEQNIITTVKDGSATIYALFDDQQIEIMNIDSSGLIVNRPNEFDNAKAFVKCEQFTDEENERIDTILENKINYVGYQTRAGAVEAMRFLAFDFPYKVDYFNENGRLPYLDAEGRYYHKGLYLSTGKYNDLKDPKRNNKGTWGCAIYSDPLGAYETNGVDCSGLVTWALYNDGFDPGDEMGANLLMTLGDIQNTKEAIESNKVKVGDFVHNNEAESHIGMIVGIDDYYYYVIQSIWYSPYGVCVTKYTKDEMINHWLQVILLDTYYKEDGLLTNMWY